jgi:hypothetical protein
MPKTREKRDKRTVTTKRIGLGVMDTNPRQTTKRSPSIKKLRDGGFSHPELPRITCEKLKLMMDGGQTSPRDFLTLDVSESHVDSCIFGCKFISVQYSSGSIILSNDILWSLRALPKDKLIIFYDNECNDMLAAAAAQALLDLDEGYALKNIKVLWQGFKRWRDLDYPFEQLMYFETDS